MNNKIINLTDIKLTAKTFDTGVLWTHFTLYQKNKQ